jgi:hypothetical protein
MIRLNGEFLFRGPNVGGFVSGGTGQTNFTERFAPTGAFLEQNALGASAQVGGGAHIGFFVPVPLPGLPFLSSGGPGMGPFVIEPFAEVGDSNQQSKIDFGNGASLSANSNFSATFGINIGPTFVVREGQVFVHGTIGASIQNEKFDFNFMPTASSESKNVWGFTTGFGVAFMPNGVQVAGMPVIFSLDYRHIAWQTVTVHMPAASPATNFDFKSSSDEVHVGAHVLIGGPTREWVTFPGSFGDFRLSH